MSEGQLKAIIEALSNAKTGSTSAINTQAMMQTMGEAMGTTLSGSNLQALGGATLQSTGYPDLQAKAASAI